MKKPGKSITPAKPGNPLNRRQLRELIEDDWNDPGVFYGQHLAAVRQLIETDPWVFPWLLKHQAADTVAWFPEYVKLGQRRHLIHTAPWLALRYLSDDISDRQLIRLAERYPEPAVIYAHHRLNDEQIVRCLRSGQYFIAMLDNPAPALAARLLDLKGRVPRKLKQELQLQLAAQI